MTVKTERGRLYKLVGQWDSNMVFAPDDGRDSEVVMYTREEFDELVKLGKLTDAGRLAHVAQYKYC